MGIEKTKGTVGTFSMAMVFIGYGITINAVGIGASLGKGMTLRAGIIAMIVGTILLSIMATLSALMGERARYTTSVIWQYVYGRAGGRIPSIVVGISLILWTFFDLWYVGAAMKGIFKSVPHVPFIIGEIIILCFCLYGSLKGLQGLAKIANATIPIAVILFAYVTYMTAVRAGGLAVLDAYVPAPENAINMATGINIVVGHFICCTGLWGDLTCEAKTKKAVIVAVPAGMLANMAIHFVGQFGVIGLNAYGLDAVANALGGVLMIILHIFTIVAVINTTPSTFHLVKIQLGTSIGHPKFWAVAGPIIGVSGAFIVEYVTSLSLISVWSQIVACVMSPVVGVSLAEFWLGRKGECAVDEMPPLFCKMPVLSLAVTFVFALICTFFIPSVPTSFGAATFGFIFHCIMLKIFGHPAVKADESAAEV